MASSDHHKASTRPAAAGAGSSSVQEESSLSVVADSGLTATFTATDSIPNGVGLAPSSTPSVAGGGGAAATARNEDFSATKTTRTTTANIAASTAATTTGSLSPALDFITTGNAVKALFSIPYENSPDPIFLAVHNVNGTLLIDQAENEQNYHASRDYEKNNWTASSKGNRRRRPRPRDREWVDDVHPSSFVLPASSQQTLALAMSPQDQSSTSEALSLLSNIMSRSANSPEDEGESDDDDDKVTSNGRFLTPPAAPREFVEWNFHDMTLIVGTDALIVRPSSSARFGTTSSQGGTTSDGITIRVEQKHLLQQAWEAFRARQQQIQQQHLLTASEEEKEDHQAEGHATPSSSLQLSYAQVLQQKPLIKEEPKKEKQQDDNPTPPADLKEEEGQQGNEEEENRQLTSSTFSEVPLQTCIVPHPGFLGGRIIQEPPPPSAPPVEPKGASPVDSTTVGPLPVSIVLDAYLDNLMANVPQLALCLQEKGLIQSIKLLQTEDIPSRMVHPSTFDTSGPTVVNTSNTKRQFNQPTTASEEETLFSPQIMDMNATALLRFLKANCTRNNATYLLRHEPVDGSLLNQNTAGNSMGHRRIQLYDISSISTQGQKKWIWWLATMSHRFALRLRHLEAFSSSSAKLSESQKRTFRDRQRSLYQQTLDLLQDLRDMDGSAHESMVASVWDHMADTFLGSGGDSEGSGEANAGTDQSPTPPPPMIQSNNALSTTTVAFDGMLDDEEGLRQRELELDEQPFSGVTIDALNKAQDHLMNGINSLAPLLKQDLQQRERDQRASEPLQSNRRRRKRPGAKKAGNGNSVQEESSDSISSNWILSPAMVMQLDGMNRKLVSVSLRLTEHHLKNYSSSNAMQALRMAARKLADTAQLLETRGEVLAPEGRLNDSSLGLLQSQYVWLYENCGHFARSFASDVLWRERGHASGDDVISVLRDVESAFDQTKLRKQPIDLNFWKMFQTDSLSEKSNGLVTLQSLSSVVSTSRGAVKAGKSVLAKERMLQRDKRRVLVASCISYDRAVAAFQRKTEDDNVAVASRTSASARRLLLQRYGDSCNETGKILLDSLRTHLLATQGKDDDHSKYAAQALLDSSQFWFGESLDAFEACDDVQNRALLRMNLCQSYKLRANAVFARDSGKEKWSLASNQAEQSLEEAANQLEKAHEELGVRDAAPRIWDMVSTELAATFLLLGTRRRQYILGDGGNPMLALMQRLQPGQERSILEPIERSLEIYEQAGNGHQAAAVHYQLALTHSKLWTCQVNETKTRQKLLKAFQHYQQAHTYYYANLCGNEAVFCLLCLDLSKLYAGIPGEKTLVKALGCCLDTCGAFSRDAIKKATEDATTGQAVEWFDKMTAIAQSVDEATFKVLRSLVQSGDQYRDMYRDGLTAKMVQNGSTSSDDDESSHPQATALLTLHTVLEAIKEKYATIV